MTIATALEGVRIIEMGQLIAIPWAMKMLADMGAQVIRLESHKRLEAYRSSDLYQSSVEGEYWNRGGMIYENNRNKLGITLNLAKEEGIGILRDLVAISDVFAENFTPRVIRNFHLEYDDLRKIRPDIIMVSSTGYGFTGPWGNFGATGPSTEGASGLAYMTGYKDGPPVLPEIPTTDYTAAEITVTAVMVSLLQRLNTGRGQFIDVSQAQATSALVPEALLDFSVNGRIEPRMGNSDPSMSPHGCYPCKGEDKWIAIAVEDNEQWKIFCKVLNCQEWQLDSRFTNVTGRLRHREELDQLVGSETTNWDGHELMRLLQSAGVAAGAVLDGKAMLFNEHLKEREFYELVSHHPSTGMPSLPYAGRPWRMSETPAVPGKAAPIIGENNKQVLGELLGLTDKKISDLEEREIIGYAPVNPSQPTQRPPLDQQVRQGTLQRYETDYSDQIQRFFGI